MIRDRALVTLLVTLAACLGLVGCIEADRDDPYLADPKPEGFRFEGQFSQEATGQDIARLRELAEGAGGLMWTVDRTPPGFDVMGLADEADCQQVRQHAAGADYVAWAAECRWWAP